MFEMDREKLEAMAQGEAPKQEKEPYVPRAPWQRALAWGAAALVLAAFLGMIYWMFHFSL